MTSQSGPSKHPLQRHTTLFTFLTAASLIIVTSLWMIGPYILSIVMAAVLTRFSQPSYSKLLKRGMRPKIAAFILTIALVLLVIVPLSLFLNIAIRQAIAIVGRIAQNESLTPQVLINYMGNLPLMDVLGISPESFSVRAHKWIQASIGSVTEFTLNWLTLLPEIILQVVLCCIAYFFILLDGRSFLAWMSCRIPFDKGVSEQVLKSFEDTAIASILATVSAGAAQACVLFFGFLLLNIPGAFLAGGATFIFSWIPLLGTTPVWIVGAIYLFSQGSTTQVVLMILLGIAAGLVDNIVRPLVLRGRSDLHPLISLIAIFGGISLFGLTGVFVGPILIAVMIALFHAWPEVAERFNIGLKEPKLDTSTLTAPPSL